MNGSYETARKREKRENKRRKKRRPSFLRKTFVCESRGCRVFFRTKTEGGNDIYVSLSASLSLEKNKITRLFFVSPPSPSSLINLPRFPIPGQEGEKSFFKIPEGIYFHAKDAFFPLSLKVSRTTNPILVSYGEITQGKTLLLSPGQKSAQRCRFPK